MKKATITINKEFKKGKIDKRIYSSFVEHMGRVVYSGIYEPTHATADKDGFRQDVLLLVKEMGVTGIRYPGGNFVSCYDWRDGVGPQEKRPNKLEIAWRAIETNEFGINEFMKWAKKAEIEPIFAVNLGTKGIENAVSLVEYCNIEGNTLYSDLRKEHGVEKPYEIETWCLGNEMDGDWQVGHKTAEEYGRLAQETAKAMKLVDTNIKLVSCGSSKSSMDTYPEWEATTLSYTYDYVDYISLHQYYDGQDKGTAYFLAQALDMEHYIQTVISTCNYVKAKKRSKKDMYISFDEWGVWSMADSEVLAEVDASPWQVAPAFSEQIYSMEDSLLFASMMMNFLKYADRIKIACQSLLTNISAAIMTEKNGLAWVQPIYYPFAYMSKYGRGTVLQDLQECETYSCELFNKVPFVDSVAVYNEKEQEIVYFHVNRCEEDISMEGELQGFSIAEVIEHVELWSENRKDTNLQNHNLVKPVKVKDTAIQGENKITYSLKALSWNMIRVKVK
ncbi:MAG: alpha-N-arabinofuranosidase [Lachnospiraceae bacterium]|nr:alpha-N-arabinofuranosidase [Lachnospiraceae bacterium]